MYYARGKKAAWVSATFLRPPTALVADRSAHRETVSTNCDTNFNFNQGCGTQVRAPDSYGEDFNAIGGGFYALARSKEYGIKVWFWPRSALFIPSDVRRECDDVNPNSWGPPTAYFPTGDDCVYEEHFDAHMLVFDLTFCVRWSPRASC
jgi:hypothetical protein